MKKNILIAGIVALITIAGGVYYWTRPTTMGNQVAAVGATVEAPTAEVKALLAKLQSHLLLPTDEAPQISPIADLTPEIQKQPFLTGAQKDDLLIVYIKTGKAIVYSPSRDLIINVGPISAPEQSTSQAPTPTPVSTSTPVKK